MTTDGVVRIAADDGNADALSDQGSAVFGVEQLTLSLPAEDGLGDICAHCNEPIEEVDDGPHTSEVTWRSESAGTICNSAPDRRHEPDTGPGTWCNSAAIEVDEDGNSVSVSISVGDPRGAFVMQVRRKPDGTLLLHLPYESMAQPHMPLKKLHEGTYEIG